MELSQTTARCGGSALANSVRNIFAALCLLFLITTTGSAHARPLELDWDTVTWTPAALSQTYTIGGRNIAVSYGGAGTAGLVPPAPGLSDFNTGGLMPAQFSLAIATQYFTVPPCTPPQPPADTPLCNDNFVTVTLDFSDYPGGVADINFDIFDVDAFSSFTDWVQIQATDTAGNTLDPTTLTVNPVMPAFAAVLSGSVVEGLDTMNPGAPPNSNGGNVNVGFTQSGITSVTITYRNTTASVNPNFQVINVHDISYDAILADISVIKDVDNPTPNVGSNVVYTITMTNDGPDAGTGLVLTDQLPAGLTWVSDDSGGAYNNVTGEWTVGMLASGASTTLQITALVNPAPPAPPPDYYNNVAELTAATSDDQDSTPGNNVLTEDDQDDALITPMQFADLQLAKTVTPLDPVVGDNVTFTVTLTNDGPIDATGVSVADDLPSGYTFVSATPSVGSYDPATGIWTVGNLAATTSVTLQITAQTLITGDYANIAQVQTSDQADPDSTPGNDDPTEDDQATAAVTPILLGVAKSISNGPVNNLDGTFSFDYAITVGNYGTADISNLQVRDDLATTFAGATGFLVTGLASADFTLNPGFNGVADTALLSGTDVLAVAQNGTIIVSITLTPGGNLGPYNNTATGDGTGPGGTPVSDDSQLGVDPDPDNDGDPRNNNVPTPVTLSEAPVIGLAKRVSAPPVANGDGSSTLTYSLLVENFGDVALSNLQIVDSLATTFAAADSFTVDAVSSADFAVDAAYDGNATTTLLAGTDTLAIGDDGTITITVTVRPGANLGPYDNTATTSGVSPAGTPVSDISTDGMLTDPDGDGDPGNNSVPTPVSFDENPLIGTNKRVLTGPVNNGDGTFTVTYELGVVNFGNVDLANVQITDDFALSFAGAGGFTVDALTSADFVVNPGFDGAADINLLAGTDTLAIGAGGTVSVTVTLDPAGNFGTYDNSANGSGTSPAGTLVQDISNDGVDPDPDNNGDPTDNNVPTPITVAEAPLIGVAKEVSTVPVSNNNGTFTFSYTMTVENYGTEALSALQVSDDLAMAFALADSFFINAVQSNDFTVNGGFDGAGDTNLLDGTDTLAVSASGEIVVTLTVAPGNFPGPYLNTAFGSGNSPSGTPVQDESTIGTDPDPDNDDDPGNNMIPTPVIFESAEIVLTKRADPTTTVAGGLVRYTVTAENTGNAPVMGLTLQDLIPAGFNFADGSAVLVGSGMLTVNGQRPIDFNGIDLNPGDIATLTYILRVGAGVVPGSYPNTVTPLLQNVPVGPPVTARVEIVADPDINETTIIGKVFTDHDEDGYQDEGETGIAGVRLVTVEGLRIETDSEGRYHIAGVDGGFMNRGRNYIVKVDPATLPPGSEFTTENPRVKRITQGLMNRFDFGVKVPAFATERTGRVKVKLAEVFFLPDSETVHPDFVPTIGELATLLRKHGGGVLYIDGNSTCKAPPAAKIYTDTETLSYTFTPRFGVRKATLTDEDRAELDRSLEPWRDAVEVSILSIGHTSSVRIAPQNRKEFADNYVLGEARAAAVANYVRASLGIDSDNVQAIGRGPDQPVASNATAEGRAMNRRVELILSGKRLIQRQEAVTTPACDTGLAKRRADNVFEALKPLLGEDLINSVQVLSAPPP